MAKLHHAVIDAKVTVLLELDEVEARALDGIFGYNVEIFLKVFKERMGSYYVENHEEGVRSLHKTIRGVVAGPLSEIDRARVSIRESLWRKAK